MCWRSSSPVVKKPLDTRPLHCGVAWGRRASARSKGRSPAGRYRCPRPCTLRVAVAVLVVVGPAHLPTGPLDMDETVLAHLLGLCSRLLWGPARPWRHLAVNVLFCFPGASHDPGSSSAAAMDAPRRGAVNVSDSPRAAERYLEAPSEYRTAGQVYCTVHTQMHKFESSIRRLVGGVAKRQTRRTAAKSPPPPPAVSWPVPSRPDAAPLVGRPFTGHPRSLFLAATNAEHVKQCPVAAMAHQGRYAATLPGRGGPCPCPCP